MNGSTKRYHTCMPITQKALKMWLRRMIKRKHKNWTWLQTKQPGLLVQAKVSIDGCTTLVCSCSPFAPGECPVCSNAWMIKLNAHRITITEGDYIARCTFLKKQTQFLICAVIRSVLSPVHQFADNLKMDTFLIRAKSIDGFTRDPTVERKMEVGREIVAQLQIRNLKIDEKGEITFFLPVVRMVDQL